MNDDDVMIEVVVKLTRGGRVDMTLNASKEIPVSVVPTLALGAMARGNVMIVELAFTPVEKGESHD